tara:strand:+ start:409 stop:1089 length:681 start_codon:yes stop_codon:yes gene_type:complete
MKKIAINFLAVLFISALSFTKAFAVDYTLGVSGAIVNLSAEGSETETGAVSAETHPASVSNTFATGSIFAEAQFGKLAFGVDYIPMDADVSDATHTRTDTETSTTGEDAEVTTARTQTAAAEVSDHITLYANYYFNDSIYLHLGYASVDVSTNESLDTGSKYGNVNIDGIQYGLGIQMTDNFRLEASYTDYDDVSITSSVARTGVTTNNKISADLDTTQVKLSYHF